MNKKIISGLVIVIMFIFIIFFAGSDNSDKLNEKIKIGWSGPLSGPVATLGEQNLRGIQLAIKDFGKEKIDLLVEDDQFVAKNTVSTYEKFKGNNVLMMLSPTYNGLMALASKADKDKIFVINSIDASSEIADAGEYILGIGYYADGHGVNFARSIESYGANKVAVFYNQGETFTQLIVNSFKSQFRGNVVLVEGYKPDINDFRTTITKMKNLGVDVVLLIGWDEAGFFIKQSNELGFTPSVFGLASFSSPGFASNAGKHNIPLNYLGWDQESAEYKEIVRKYQAEFNSLPSEPLFVALGYDSMSLILKALERGYTSKEFGKNIYEISLNGLTGTLALDRDGIVRGITAQSKIFRVK